MRKLFVALAAGFLTAAAITGLPASAANAPIAAQGITWNPASVTITAGDSVTWSNPESGFHDVCVAKAGADVSTCNMGDNEFRNGAPNSDWSNYTNSHVFNTAGTYRFMCEFHGQAMSGTVTVKAPESTGTTTTETITDTTTQPTNTTPTNTAPAPDTTAPAFTGKLKRKASRTSLILQLGSTEDATLDVAVFRRPPGKRSFTKVGQASLNVKQGRNTVTVPRKAAGKVRSGAYRVKLKLVDAAGNESASRTLVYKIA